MAVVISQDLVISALDGSVYPLTHARIGYQSYIEEGMLTYAAGTPVDGFPIDNALTSQTFEVAKIEEPVTTLDVDFGEAKTIDYMALTSKNITTYNVQYYDGAIWHTIVSSSSTNTAKMALFTPVSARYWKIFVFDSNGGELQLANIKLGFSLAMMRPIYGGHSPSTLSRQTVITPTISEGGEFLSSSVRRQGFKANYDYQHLDPDWYRNYFDPFVEYARTGTYYIAWRPEDYPDEVIYGWTVQDIIPSNMGIRGLMSVGWSIGGYDAS